MTPEHLCPVCGKPIDGPHVYHAYDCAPRPPDVQSRIDRVALAARLEQDKRLLAKLSKSAPPERIGRVGGADMTPERLDELRRHGCPGWSEGCDDRYEEMLNEIERLNKLVWRLKHRVEQAWRDLGDSQSYEGNP